MSKKIPVSISVHVTGEFFMSGQFGNIDTYPKIISNGQYGLVRGLDRVLDAADARNIPCTFFIVGGACEVYPDKLRQIPERGHEVANHGLNHENFANFTYDEQLEILEKSNALIKKATGVTPKGFRGPVGDITIDTLKALSKLGFSYSSSLYDDDFPYAVDIEGKPSGLVEIPVKWPLYDLPYFYISYGLAFPSGQGRIGQYTRALENWKIEYEAAERYEIPYVLQVDTQTIGTPGKIGLLEELMDFIIARGTGEFMTLEGMAAQKPGTTRNFA